MGQSIAWPHRASPVWIMGFENGEGANQAKRVIYIYLDDHGDCIGANHTGKR